MRARLAAAVLTLLVAGAVASTGGAQSTTDASQAISVLDQQRASNGIPAAITENPTLSHDCAAHDAYMAANNMLTHSETPGSPGYTPGGAYAGQNSVLTQGAGWAAGDPYNSAPIHLDQLLAPRLQTIGSAAVDGYSCTTTFPGWIRPDPTALTVYTYPGQGTTIAPQETASEQPFTPGQLVGIPAGAATGPYLIVLVDAPRQSPLDDPATLTGATLTGPSGAVSVKTVDGTTPLVGSGGAGPAGPTGTTGTLSGYISPGGFIIPTAPLQPAAHYTAHVVVGFAGVQTPYTWTFVTSGRNPQSSLAATGSVLAFRSASPAPVTVMFTSVTGAHAPTVTIAPGATVTLHLAPGTWTACGSQPAKGDFASYQQCLTLTVSGVPVLSIGAARISGQRVLFPVRLSAVLVGRTATATTTALLRSCVRHRCGTRPGMPTSRSITLSSGLSLSLPLPAKGSGVEVTLSVGAFQVGGASYTAVHASARYVRP